MAMDRTTLMKKLIEIHFERTNADLSPAQFRSIGSRVEFMPVSEQIMYAIDLETVSGGKRSSLVGAQGPTLRSRITKITKIEPVSSKIISEEQSIFIFPAKHFITEDS